MGRIPGAGHVRKEEAKFSELGGPGNRRHWLFPPFPREAPHGPDMLTPHCAPGVHPSGLGSLSSEGRWVGEGTGTFQPTCGPSPSSGRLPRPCDHIDCPQPPHITASLPPASMGWPEWRLSMCSEKSPWAQGDGLSWPRHWALPGGSE